MAGPSNTRRISGSVPGLLDPSQPERLFRLPGSRLQFASFDPLAATAQRDVTGFRKFSTDGKSCRPKRIVIEITPSGDSFWRYVPNARLDDGVEDEGEWPRQVEICGDMIECSQDQWDIYKLDSLYECRVRIPPNLGQITRATDTKTAAEALERKRPASTSPIEGPAPLGRQRKRACPNPKGHCQNGHADVRDDMMDVEAMDVDELPPTKDEKETDFPKTYRAERKVPGHNGGRRPQEAQTYVPCELTRVHLTEELIVADIPEFLSTLDDFSRERTTEQQFIYATVHKGKRARTASPTSARRELKSKLLGREIPKRHRREQDFLVKQQRREEKLFKDLMADAQQMHNDAQGDTQNGVEEESLQSEEDEEVARRIAIEESRRKLAELEGDKHLWEAAAKQRSMREEAERGSIRVKVATLHSVEKERAEAERKARTLREAEEKRKEDERRQHEAAAQRERESRQRQQQRWAYGPWTTQRALERYKVLSEEFDSTKFSTELPLTVEAVPWPILTPPARLNIADVNWNAVEKFFTSVENHMKPQEYKVLVEKSHRRFHPDRWRSRSLWKTVVDETERDGMEVGKGTLDLIGCAALMAFNTLRLLRSPSGSMDAEPHRHASPRRTGSADDIIRGSELVDQGVLMADTSPSTTGPMQAVQDSPQRQRQPAFSRIASFFGIGRNASPQRKLNASLIQDLAWNLSQIVIIVIMLVLTGTYFRSVENAHLSEWSACDRPLGVWSCIWIFRACLSTVLAVWDYKRNTNRHANDEETRPSTANIHNIPASSPVQNANPTLAQQSTNTQTTNTTENPERPAVRKNRLYSRLTLFSSLLTLSWFLVAHILEYTSINTCRRTSPHLWWLMFGILSIMYLMVLEVVVLGVFVFIVGPILYLLWNLVLIAMGRHPLQNPGMISPEIGKLSRTVVDRIPLVMYIPPPPTGLDPMELTKPEVIYSYPPQQPLGKAPSKPRFRFFRRLSSKERKTDASDSSNQKLESESEPKGLGDWEDNWEQSELPFVILEDNRAACAICLNDFEAPRRKAVQTYQENETKSISSDHGVADTIAEEERDSALKLEDAGEGAQPLRLLKCGHVFHKTCLDPWLTNVSGRCPVCQKAVELPIEKKKTRRQSDRSTSR
ncbi:hypothetical protein M378DRAFT_75405 [Amanita muscaria Koide BX008]|uniref:RING-type domain-containing protein n=1 Tax=Amanita muscaria (strain Koide BX008) TaxID=946122 RepID=A0A0C2TH00_AMAMK|nr:hypothetical protein M378DRAFT_75405 [Amanita muscaria Koide BX008]